jgi:hypothetical protein
MGRPIPFDDAMALIALHKFRLECLSRNLNPGIKAELETDYVYFDDKSGTFFAGLKQLLDTCEDFVVYLALTKQRAKGELTPSEFNSLKEIVKMYQAGNLGGALQKFLDFQKINGQLVETVIVTGMRQGQLVVDHTNPDADAQGYVLYNFGGHCSPHTRIKDTGAEVAAGK